MADDDAKMPASVMPKLPSGWDGCLIPQIAQVVWHYKSGDESDTPAPAIITLIGVDKRVAGVRIIHGGMYYEAFRGAVHMDFMLGQDKKPLTPTQRSNSGGWRHTPDTLFLHRLASEMEKMSATVVSLTRQYNIIQGEFEKQGDMKAVEELIAKERAERVSLAKTVVQLTEGFNKLAAAKQSAAA